MRTVAAFLLAPLAPAGLAAFFALSPFSYLSSWSSPLFAASVFYGYPLIALFGVPLYVCFRRRCWLRLWQVLAAGAAVGSIVPLAFVFADATRAKTVSEAAEVAAQGLAPVLLFGVAVGVLVALAFWLIAVGPFRKSASVGSGEASAV